MLTDGTRFLVFSLVRPRYGLPPFAVSSDDASQFELSVTDESEAYESVFFVKTGLGLAVVEGGLPSAQLLTGLSRSRHDKIVLTT